MKIKHFEKLSEQEYDILIKTPALITVLIAGADEHIDKAEKRWAAKIVKFRKVSTTDMLHTYYEEIDQIFESMLNDLIEESGDDAKSRKEIIGNELSKLNVILPKIEQNYAKKLMESWKSLAVHVAKASGGILSYGNISKEERELIELPMIKYKVNKFQ